MWSGSWPCRHFSARSGTTWDRASLMLPLMTSVSRRARRSPMPTQLNGRRIVYGSSYCSHAPLAKYSDASFWKPYVEIGGGEDPLVLSEQVIGKLVEVADPADHRRGRDDLVALAGEPLQQLGVLCVAL